ncbi:hypothetical protein [Bradyrhizobium liaoningense]|uniref:hypothetical protein n=1 Tax=Bradyrhizobium liaoningense TaxID=43992 RepID=UPI000551A078|nr:hypothetical protein [Bradyrhizobium liaoningense]
MTDQQPQGLYFRKNPYHLFHTFLKTKAADEVQHQVQSAKLLEKKLREHFPKKGARVHMSEQKFSEFIGLDYIQWSGDWRRWHARAMNEIISEARGGHFDILDSKQRAALEREIGYLHPPPHDRDGTDPYLKLRGVWQLLYPSTLRDHVKDRKSRQIRAAILLVYGFVADHDSVQEKTELAALIIGRTGVWNARLWMHVSKLWLVAEDRATKEDQFYIFGVPGFGEPFAWRDFNSMVGAIAGTVLDGKYNSRYPIVTAPCAARRLDVATTWFNDRDALVDDELVHDLKELVPRGYMAFGEIEQRSVSGDPVKAEYYHGLTALLQSANENESYTNLNKF